MAEQDRGEPTEPSNADLSAESDGTEREPATVGATSTGATAAGATSIRPAAPGPKGTPTAKRDLAATTERTTPAKFVRQSVGELRKVVYPTGQQLINYFVVVLVFVLFIIAYVSLLDLGLGWAVLKVFS